MVDLTFLRGVGRLFCGLQSLPRRFCGDAIRSAPRKNPSFLGPKLEAPKSEPNYCLGRTLRLHESFNKPEKNCAQKKSLANSWSNSVSRNAATSDLNTPFPGITICRRLSRITTAAFP